MSYSTSKFLFSLLLTGLLLAACADNDRQANTDYDHSEDSTTMLVKGEIDDLPKASDLQFEKALADFEHGNSATAAEYIGKAIENLREESPALAADAKKHLDQSIAELRGLVDRIQKGDIKDITTLETTFAQAEMRIAHEYLVFTDVYAVEEPEKAHDALRSAVERMENAANRLEGKAKEELEEMVMTGKTFLAQSDIETDKIDNAEAEHIEEMSVWLKKHF